VDVLMVLKLGFVSWAF